MSKNDFILPVNLQVFAGEGGGAGGGTGTGGATGVTGSAPGSQMGGTDLSGVQYGIPAGGQVATADDDRASRFDEMIKGEYKDLYDAKVQDIVQRRLRNSKETVDKYNALTPTLELLSKKYGVDASDIKALTAAIEEDDSYYEDEALEKGITVEQLKSIKKMEKENAELKAQMREKEVRQNADRIYAQWMDQAQQMKSVYPSFDLNAELRNQKFVDLLRSNIDVRTAYEVVHKDEIIPAAMNFTAKQVEQKLTNKIMASGSRPMENGTSSNAPTIVKSDVSQLSKADRQEIARRVARGEKIRF